ncbi:hypothetical protein [Gemmatimonas sp.]|jgi:futalosine hydrolase|uniref:phosphorylase family protein n=1 Tax=Gemmatimonas sp. TaxID=1962908 RepID=UPI0022C9787F|nr:hypothetical protein [Gemmatimonas sp.]MCA2984285.1 hypothetical protein [Gemmatimonas sp.]MCA2986405.1 hypothetical protein [Gemmatimonas sp.]MCA2990756.1 hypothetical protein [Gemmatimonas sp.]MCA2995034.1 hypothetical protein [Gemmatimonas sp.]MCE2955026.1 hypothetical protein [Gemmatimonas sp.]
MTSPARILVVAATSHELAPPGDWIGALCGVGPVEAAVRTARAITEHRPDVLLHVGIAGARRRWGCAPGTLVVGERSRYCDLGDLPAEWAPRDLTPSAALLQLVRDQLPHARCTCIGTSGRVGGTSDCDVEAMEGFAVLRAAQLAGVPAIEVRAISNDIEEPDRTRWQFGVALAAIVDITPPLVAALRTTRPHHA